MGTRSGSVDPGILTYLMRTGDGGEDQFDDVLNHRSGLLGISGVSSDMRDILEAIRSRNGRAKLAFEMFVHRLQAGIGAMVTSLGGLDALVFTAGMAKTLLKSAGPPAKSWAFSEFNWRMTIERIRRRIPTRASHAGMPQSACLCLSFMHKKSGRLRRSARNFVIPNSRRQCSHPFIGYSAGDVEFPR